MAKRTVELIDDFIRIPFKRRGKKTKTPFILERTKRFKIFNGRFK